MNDPKLKSLTPVTARGEATRRKLIEAAEYEFGNRGFHAASVSSITQRAGVGQGTFYLYFHAKEEIFVTVVAEIGRNLRKATALAVACGSGRMDSERRSLVAFFEFACQHPGLYRIVQEAQFVDEAVFKQYYERLASGYAQGLKSAAEHGQLTLGDAHVRAWAIMGIGHMLGLKYCLWADSPPSEQLVDEAMRFISSGMAAPNAR